MAEIFLARAQSMHGFEKQVVLKRILPQHAQSEDFIRMFLAEARLAATLHHPNIVQVYDIGEEGGTYFFTMEYIQGEDLRRLVRAARRKQTPIPLAHILHIIMGMAGGLHHAHEKVGNDGRPLGIVHRDVSPSNVLVTYEGDVKVVDFGIAKAAAAQVSTIAGTLKGKIPYMSPEQCRGEAVDRRSDIFSIGTLLWELTTGKRLFAGENEFAILNRVAKADVPPPSSVRPEYPPELEAIVMRALNVDPERRYDTAIDLQIDLEDFAREARLPVSSARMGRFVRGLFEEELRAAQAELAEARADVGHTMIVSPSSSPEGFSDLTPSELRLHAEPTPGLIGDGSTGSGTDISVAKSLPRRNPAIALGAGFLLTLGVGGGLFMAFGGGDGPSGEPAAAAVSQPDSPSVQPTTPVAAPDGEPEAADGLVGPNGAHGDPGAVPNAESPSGIEDPSLDPTAGAALDAPGAKDPDAETSDRAGDRAGDRVGDRAGDRAGGDPSSPTDAQAQKKPPRSVRKKKPPKASEPKVPKAPKVKDPPAEVTKKKKAAWDADSARLPDF